MEIAILGPSTVMEIAIFGPSTVTEIAMISECLPLPTVMDIADFNRKRPTNTQLAFFGQGILGTFGPNGGASFEV